MVSIHIGISLILLLSTLQGLSYQEHHQIINTGLYPSSEVSVLNDENYYFWEDEFDNAQKIDETYSEHFIVSNGNVEMYGTYPQWTDADWTRMKEIAIESTVSIEDCVIKLIVDYDSDMKADYADLRFKFNDDDYWLPYWIEEINPVPNDPYAIVWVRISLLSQGESKMYLFYGNPSATYQGEYWDVFDENSWQRRYPLCRRIQSSTSRKTRRKRGSK